MLGSGGVPAPSSASAVSNSQHSTGRRSSCERCSKGDEQQGQGHGRAWMGGQGSRVEECSVHVWSRRHACRRPANSSMRLYLTTL